MTLPSKVAGFLDVAGAWDPSLALVMVGAIGVYFVASALSRRRRRALFGEAMPPAPSSKIDARLVGGALLFGVGWGLSGFCPGPALVALGAGLPAALWFVPALLVGTFAARVFVGAYAKSNSSSSEPSSEMPSMVTRAS